MAEGHDRAKLARDLHDRLGGTLAAVKLNITSFENDFATADKNLQKFYDHTVTLLNKAGDELRGISRNIVTGEFAKKGLTQVLNEKIDQLNSNQQLRFIFISNCDEMVFNVSFELAIYRIFIELIDLVVKHADVRLVTLQYIIDRERDVIMIVAEDDGKSSTQSDNTIGIKNLYEQISMFNGIINVDSGAQGSTLIIELPFNFTNFFHGA